MAEINKVLNYLSVSKIDSNFAKRSKRVPPKKVWYTKKSVTGGKKVYFLSAALYDMVKETNQPDNLYFITITPPQHFKEFNLYNENIIFRHQRNSDKFYLDGIKAIFRNNANSYICCCERQRNTGNLHFHLLVVLSNKEYKKINNFRKFCRNWVKRVSKVLNVPQHDTLFDIKKISDFKGVISYTRKMFGNHNAKTLQKYSSLFQCRTFTYTRNIGAYYKINANRYHRRVKPQTIIDNWKELELKIETDFCKIYHFNEKVFAESELNDNLALEN